MARVVVLALEETVKNIVVRNRMSKSGMRRPVRKKGRTNTRIRNDHKEYAVVADLDTVKDTWEVEVTLVTAKVTAE